MPVPNLWKETGGSWQEDHTLLSDEQLGKCGRAYEVEDPSPIPTRLISNGEYMPVPQSQAQKRVAIEIETLAETASKKLGISRRHFLGTSGGTAAAFMAMNKVFGHFFKVDEAELFESGAAAANGLPKDVMVVDDQLHFVRGTSAGAPTLRAIAQGPTSAASGITSNPFNPTGLLDELGSPWTPWNPALVGLPIDRDFAHIVKFIKQVFLDSQVTVGLLSNVTAFVSGLSGSVPGTPAIDVNDARTGEVLTARQTAAGRDFINQIAGSRRAMAHGLLYVGKGNLDYIQYQIDNHHPDAWKGYCISHAAKVDSGVMRQWRQDDPDVAYPTYELIVKNLAKQRQAGHGGFHNICVHKGLAHGLPATPQNGFPSDLPQACRDFPMLNFVTYHSCIQDTFFDAFALQAIRATEAGTRPLMHGVPNIDWVTPFAVMTAPFKNSFAEIGTTFASSVVTFPTVTAHILGQLLKFKGHNQILFGSDSVWYGSPQWQLEALWRFQIPEAIREKWGYPELTESAKRHILGLNAARIYELPVGTVSTNEDSGGFGGTEDEGKYRPVPTNFEQLIPDSLKVLLEYPGNPQNLLPDNLSKVKDRYLAMGVEPTRTRYGWVRVRP
jgi:predicted TIM-barrel fold metal-dependent hydrolase